MNKRIKESLIHLKINKMLQNFLILEF